MPGKFNFEVRYKYPHLIGEDTEVWSRFILKFPDRFDTVDYDVKVGKGADTDPIPEEHYKKQWATLTKKRIDVIGYKNDVPCIVEVKKRASLFTLGQVLGYRFLYLREHPELRSIRTLIVCSSIDPDDIAVLNYFGIPFFVV